MKRIITALTILALSIALCQAGNIELFASEGITETVKYVPALTGTNVEDRDGKQYLIKVYEGNPEYEPDLAQIINEPFEFEGYFYAYSDMETNEIMREEAKWERMEVSFPIAEDDLQAVYHQLQPSIPYHGEDGYNGRLDLDYTAVWTQVAGYEAKSFTMTDSVTVTGLSSNDSSNIPKTRTRSGVTMQLQSVDWTVQESTNIGYETVPTKYTAVAHYSGKYSKNVPTGYLARAWYGGVVTKASVDRVVYSIAYIGEQLLSSIPNESDAGFETEPTPSNEPNAYPDTIGQLETDGGEEQQEDKSPIGFIIGLTSAVLALAGLAAGAYFYFGNTFIYAPDGEEMLYITRRFLNHKNPVLDISRLKTDEDELAIQVKKRVAAKLIGQQIETIVSPDYTHRCRVRSADKDFWYRVYIERTGTSDEGTTPDAES